MKNTWNILFVLFLLFETACNSPSQSIKNTDLVAEDSICFPIDEHTCTLQIYTPHFYVI